MFKILAALLAVMAIVYSNCAPAEEREVEEEGQTDQIFYDIFSSCSNSSDCASRLIYKTCRQWPIVGYKCSLF